MKCEGFPRALRLRRRADFLQVQGHGEKHHMRHFVVFVTRLRAREISDGAPAGTLPPPKMGVTVTRKVGGAVVRNRIKRLVRESFRKERGRFAPGLSMVWVAKRDAGNVTYAQVLSDMQTLARRLSRARSRPTGAEEASR